MIEAASVCTRSGKVLLSRQFVDITSERIHELLAALPRLVHAGSQHTTVEDGNVRYIWEPLDDLYVVLLTDLSSNILQDIKTLRLLAKIIQGTVPAGSAVDEAHVIQQAFSIIDGFDEVVTAGQTENLTLAQVQTFLDMESHEEKIQEIIERNKQLEAAEERKTRAKQLELQRKHISPYGGAGMDLPTGPSVGGFQSVSSGMPSPSPMTSVGSAAPEPSRFAPGVGAAPKGKGLKLGKSSRNTVSSTPLLADPEPIHRKEPASVPAVTQGAPKHTSNETEISLTEALTIEVSRDGQMSGRATGQVNLYAGDRTHSKLRVHTKFDGPATAYRPHPKMDRGLFASSGVVGLRNPAEEFPATSVLLVKYTVEKVAVPLSVNCWVSESSDPGFMNVTLEYELDPSYKGTLDEVQVRVPLLSSNAHVLDPAAIYEQFDDHLVWTIPKISSSEASTGSFELTAEADNEDDFYPLSVSFTTKQDQAFGRIDVTEVTDAESGEPVPFSKTLEAHTQSFTVR